ncbi:aldehyde dehydrogenase [Streptomyces ossamyceticus]|uniref:aldehyde dehydrogenase n=1 Tax=Streptomyces ossamyceticus TaxID=249581 RepID=UPI0006E26749|nr:aldehyde dehydrogenase [Streptomyces ossamyceticus]
MPSSATRDSFADQARKISPPSDAFIGGRFVPAVSGQRFSCLSPRDGALLAEVAECGPEDVDRAVRAAREAFEAGPWPRLSPQGRRKVLLRFARLIDENSHELALLESLDMGKPVMDALHVDVPLTVRCFEFYAEAVDKLYDEVAPTGHDVVATITREPLGVVGAVVPWNFPLMLAAWKIAPALAAGNCVVLKPAEQSPLTALRIAELADEAGFPPGVLNVVPGFGPTAGAALGRHPEVDLIAFTGSGPVGRLFLRYAAESNLKQVALELGGKSPQLVFPDADLDQAAQAVAGGVMFNQGEVCAAGSRLLVHESIREEFVAKVVDAAKAWTVGDPLDPATRVGALVEEKHLQRVLGHVEAAHADGARLLLGGNRARVSSGGWYLEPTVFDEVRPDARLAQEEVFGPVLAVLGFRTTEEAVALANGTRFGLAAAVWTQHLTTAHQVSRALKAGSVWVNNFNDSDITTPFGGYKESGNGRDRSLHALDKYTQLKTTWIQL